MEIQWKDSLFCPTEEEYELMVKFKRGGLCILAIRLMQTFSKNFKMDENFAKLSGKYKKNLN